MKKYLLGFAVVCCTLLAITGGYEPVSADNDTGTVTDIDGNVYQTVKIGNQVWMAENLRTTKYNDGTPIPLVTDDTAWKKLTTPGYCYYNNTTNADSIKKYGALYNWYVVNTKKLAPKGWHVPTDAEWTTLENYLIANGYNWDGTKTSNKIAKSLAAKTDWETNANPGAIGNDLTKNNRNGFSALPGGCRDNRFGNFNVVGYYGIWWSASVSDNDASYAYNRHLISDFDRLTRLVNGKSYGCSVRLLRDNASAERTLTQAGPLNAEGCLELGIAHAEAGRSQEAIEAFKQAIKLKPDYVEAHAGLGLAYSKIGDKGSALEEYKILKTLDAEMANELLKEIETTDKKLGQLDAEGYLDLGVAHGEAGRYQEAIEAFKQAIKLKPDLAEAHYNLGLAYANLGRWKEVIETCKQAIKLKPDYAEAHNNLGVAYDELGRNQEAIEAYKQAIKLEPDLAKAHYNLGITYANLGRWKEVIEACKQAIKLKPDYAEAYYNLGLAYANLDRWKEVIEACKQAIKLKPDFTEAHNNLGLAYANLGRWQEAIEAYKQAIRLKPDHAMVHNNLGIAYLKIGDKGAALEEYKILKTLNPEMANKLFNLIYK